MTFIYLVFLKDNLIKHISRILQFCLRDPQAKDLSNHAEHFKGLVPCYVLPLYKSFLNNIR